MNDFYAALRLAGSYFFNVGNCFLELAYAYRQANNGSVLGAEFRIIRARGYLQRMDTILPQGIADRLVEKAYSINDMKMLPAAFAASGLEMKVK